MLWKIFFIPKTSFKNTPALLNSKSQPITNPKGEAINPKCKVLHSTSHPADTSISLIFSTNKISQTASVNQKFAVCLLGWGWSCGALCLLEGQMQSARNTISWNQRNPKWNSQTSCRLQSFRMENFQMKSKHLPSGGSHPASPWVMGAPSCPHHCVPAQGTPKPTPKWRWRQHQRN